MNQKNPDECCARFDPVPWDEKELKWTNKLFVQDRVRSLLRVPLNFGAVMHRNMERIEAANAVVDPTVVLSDENSLWGADVYIAAAKEVPNARNVALTGTFLSKVFEGPYGRARQWIKEMEGFVAARGKTIRKLYFYYTTCPKCAEKYGKNYVVLIAQV